MMKFADGVIANALSPCAFDIIMSHLPNINNTRTPATGLGTLLSQSNLFHVFRGSHVLPLKQFQA